ncbi:MAG: His-Xaa-Ser system protein HxsD [Smithella sp.]
MKSINNFIYDISPTQANITLDISIYAIEAIHAASYAFIDRYHIIIEPESDKLVMVLFEAKDKTRRITEDIKDFATSLIDHQLRLQLEKTNGKIRDLIVAHAFSPLDLKKEIKSL